VGFAKRIGKKLNRGLTAYDQNFDINVGRAAFE
jgi:hypothetical protein